ncbi:MAG: hypothetical protein EHM77_09295, partial [Planctomycetaceae bacterium]
KSQMTMEDELTRKNFNEQINELGLENRLTDKDEQDLEPGLDPFIITEKETEIAFIKNHKTIPDELKPKLIDFLEKHLGLFTGHQFSDLVYPPEKFTHEVELNDPNFKELRCKPYPATGIRLAQLKEAIGELVEKNILIKSDSNFLSPCFFVTKKATGTKTASRGRLCYDYRKINEKIKSLNFPLTHQSNFFETCSNFKYFCVVDISNAFLSIKLTESAQKLLAITTPFGVFLPTRTPFGLKTSPSAFCFALDQIIGHLPFLTFYMDDIVIGANTPEDMMDNLLTVLQILSDNNLKIQLTKTKFFEKEIKILGMVFSSLGRKIDPEKIRAISDFKSIDTLKRLQSFLGMIAYVANFIPHYATVCYPLFHCLKNQKAQGFRLTEEAMVAFEKIKKFLKQKTILYNVDYTKPLYLATDASQVGMGSFLYQLDFYERTQEGKEKMIKDLGFVTENSDSPFLVPGIGPGKKVPVVTTFLKDKNLVKKYDKLNLLESDLTMVEKVKLIQEKYIIFVKPVSWYSKTFSINQILRYTSMEKEFLSLAFSLNHYKDMIASAPITFVITDSQCVLWALTARESNLKI